MNIRELCLTVGLSLLACGGLAGATVKTETVEYKDGPITLKGYLAYDDALTGRRPGVLVVHEWWGLNDYAKQRARQLAELDYVAFAADIYGNGVVVKTPDEARELAMKFCDDRVLLRRRVLAGLEVLRKQPRVDTSKIAAIGYCFGGTAVLELARSGANIAGVVSFHGGLDTTKPAQAGAIKAKVLVLTGADDPGAPIAQVGAFQDEMRRAGADWTMISYGGAVHSFTNPAAGDDPSKGAAYNAKADRRSWRAMRDFFDEIFAQTKDSGPS